ncbi:flavin monoamine oxidase family protein [uncultured Methylobacterium sp.]|uniref:flavin monoamine oxidase family protein n=1 Tax=uncultured Methylobacterium sp. TaxID=157278 RepID=UPI0035C99078
MRPTRRSVLIGSALLASPGVRASRRDGPVVVIGAGAAGLAAAGVLRRAGRAFTLIEARGRIGGRAHTDASLGADGSFDAGAQYIHWAERNPWAAIANRDGIRIAGQEGWARTLFVDGHAATDDERARRRAAFSGLDAAVKPPADRDRSIAEGASAAGPDMVDAAAGLCRLSLGEEPERVSSVDYDRLWSGTDLWVDGYGALIRRTFAAMPVALDTVAAAIDWSGDGARVATNRGTLDAAAVILTVSVGVLAAGSIRFTPSLPAATQAALSGLGMGAYSKIGLRLDPARIDLKAVGDAVSVARKGDADLTIYFEMSPFDRPLAVANLGGDGSRALCAAGEAAAVAEATDRLVAILGSGARGAVTGGRLAGWWTDPFARGSYSVAKPGHADARTALQQAVGEHVFLAGEALAGGGAMTVGGATLDGERAARAVLRLLG